MKNQSSINLPQHIENYSISSTNIIQWKSQGFANNTSELMDLISKEKSDVLCIHEAMLSSQPNFNLRYSNGLFKGGHKNQRTHGRVANFIHENVPYWNLTLNISLQSIAARINIGSDVIEVSIYNSRSHDISEKLLSNLFQQLTKSVIMTGDFNSYKQTLGSPVNDNRGDKVFTAHPILECHRQSFM